MKQCIESSSLNVGQLKITVMAFCTFAEDPLLDILPQEEIGLAFRKRFIIKNIKNLII